MKTNLKLLIFFICFGFSLFAQTEVEKGGGNSRKILDVFLDCSSCDMQYFMEGLTFVNFAREPETSDVHIIVTSIPAAGGGTAFSMEFSGKGRFATLGDTLTFSSSAENTEDEIRAMMLSKVELGLVPFVLKTPDAGMVEVFYTKQNVAEIEPEADPWRNWIFSVYFLGSANMEKSYKSINIMSGFYGAKVTREAKFEFTSNFAYTEYHHPDYYDPLNKMSKSILKDFSGSGLYVKSIGSHFGLGTMVGVKNNSFNNLHLRLQIDPTIEYSLFDYNEASRRQMRILYSVGYEHSDYVDMTIYNKISDHLFRQQLKVGFMTMDKFGTIEAQLYGASYLHDFSKFSLGMRTSSRIRLFKGFSITANVSLDMLRDQIALSGADMNAEELNNGLRELQTDFRFGFGLGFSYWFGSANSNIVNPRFEL